MPSGLAASLASWWPVLGSARACGTDQGSVAQQLFSFQAFPAMITKSSKELRLAKDSLEATASMCTV